MKETNNDATDWSSPLSIVEGIKKLQDTRSVNIFKKKLKPKLKTFGDRDFVLIDNAMTEKENEVLRGF